MFKELDKDTKKLFDKKFLSRTTALELVINEKCQNSCTYCYRKFKHVKSPVFSVEPSQVKTMVDRFLNVIQEDAKDFFKNRKIELFGGDGLIDYQYTKKLLKILDEYNP